MKDNPAKNTIKAAATNALHTTTNEQAFKKQMGEQGINVVIRRNEEGRMYGVTFIDHNSRTVWNASRLSKELSANAINEHWTNYNAPQIIPTEKLTPIQADTKDAVPENGELHEFFDFLDSDQSFGDLVGALGGLLPEARGDDYEELAFTNSMKRKKKNKRPGQQQ